MKVQDVGPDLPEPAAEAGHREGIAVREAERVVGNAGDGHAGGGAGELVASERPHHRRHVRSPRDGEVLDDALLAAQTHVIDHVEDLHGMSVPPTATRAPPSACERLSASMICRDGRLLAGHEWRAVAADRRDHAGQHLGMALGLARLTLGLAVGPATEVAAQDRKGWTPRPGPAMRTARRHSADFGPSRHAPPAARTRRSISNGGSDRARTSSDGATSSRVISAAS